MRNSCLKFILFKRLKRRESLGCGSHFEIKGEQVRDHLIKFRSGASGFGLQLPPQSSQAV